MSTCRRTAGILDAWLDAGQLGERDARHVTGCPRCTAGLARVDVADAEIRSAVRSLVLEAAAVGVGPTPRTWSSPRIGTPRMRFGAGLASLAAVLVLAVVVGTRLSTAPAAPGEPLLPVEVGLAEQALHQSGLRCTEIASGLECERRLSDGWRQVARLDMASEAIRGLEVRLVPGTGAFPVLFRSALWRGKTTPDSIPFDEAQNTAVVVLVDDHMTSADACRSSSGESG